MFDDVKVFTESSKLFCNDVNLTRGNEIPVKGYVSENYANEMKLLDTISDIVEKDLLLHFLCYNKENFELLNDNLEFLHNESSIESRFLFLHNLFEMTYKENLSSLFDSLIQEQQFVGVDAEKQCTDAITQTNDSIKKNSETIAQLNKDTLEKRKKIPAIISLRAAAKTIPKNDPSTPIRIQQITQKLQQLMTNQITAKTSY